MPVLDSATKNLKFSFSFQYFKQIENFGFFNVSNTWFSSLFEKLKELSGIHISEFVRNAGMMGQWRYHPIDWDATNIPIQRSELDWVDKNIIENDEYVFYQFQITTGLGRVIGYPYENIFNVVLFDPQHNMQPAKRNSYKIRHSDPVDTDISLLLHHIDNVK